MTYLCGGVDNENQLVRPAKAGTGHARGDVFFFLIGKKQQGAMLVQEELLF